MRNILIVDDSWLQRRMIKGLLKDQDLDITEAGNGIEALHKILEVKPDCILLDLLMPEMDGIEVLTVLNKDKIPIPVIVLSADIQKTTYNKCIELGAAGFLNKPVDQEQLLEMMRNVVEKQEEPDNE